MRESEYIRKQAPRSKRLKVVKPEHQDDKKYHETLDAMVKKCGHPMGSGCGCPFDVG